MFEQYSEEDYQSLEKMIDTKAREDVKFREDRFVNEALMELRQNLQKNNLSVPIERLEIVKNHLKSLVIEYQEHNVEKFKKEMMEQVVEKLGYKE